MKLAFSIRQVLELLSNWRSLFSWTHQDKASNFDAHIRVRQQGVLRDLASFQDGVAKSKVLWEKACAVSDVGR